MSQVELLITKTDIEPYGQVSTAGKEEKFLHQAILAAQNMDVKPVLNPYLWLDLIKNRTADKYVELLEGKEYTVDGKTLVFQGLKAALACFAYARYIVRKPLVDTPFGAMTKQSDYGQPADPKLIGQVASDAAEQGAQYLAEVIEFLDNNKTTYPLHTSTCSSANVRGYVRLTPASRF